MTTTHAIPQSSVPQRTAPYLGVACLALLALVSVQGFAPEASATSTRRALAIPALSWLSVPAAAAQPLLAAAHWAAHAAEPAAARAAFALACAALFIVALALLAQRLRQAAAHTQGSLSAPALLVAVALARAH